MKKKNNISRRSFIQKSTLGTLALGLLSTPDLLASNCKTADFKISLAQWSLHRSLGSGKIDALDFPVVAKKEFGIAAVEYVNSFFIDKANDKKYLAELNKRAADNNVKNVLIMVDREGRLGESDDKKRNQSVENHYKWVDAAVELGCHAIRVNAGGPGDRNVLKKSVVKGLGKLCEYGQEANINVIVENHGGFSSDGSWLAGVIEEVNMPNCGTLPDFGNFCIKRIKDENGNRKCIEEYDRYKGVAELMPRAKAVSAKSHDFDKNGNETHTDFYKMMKIVLQAGYRGYVGIEYEGGKDDEYTGIRKTRDLLIKIQKGEHA